MTRGALLPLALLLAYGVAFASMALGVSPIAFDDHPGQLYRVWHVVVHGWAPWAWNPGWWAGYPELQFYPPGLSYLGALVHTLSRGAVSVAASYHALVWLAYLAPALTVWLLLRRVLGDGWAALPGAFVALTLSGDLPSGVEGGVHIGMVPARLAWAALPILPLALSRWMDGGRGFPWSVAPLIAAVVLTHPAHLPAVVTLVLLAAWLAAAPRRSAFVTVTVALGLAAGLTAFWTVPLLAHAEHTRALAWGSLSPRALLGQPLLMALVGLSALGAGASLRGRRDAAPTGTLLTLFPWAMTAVVLIDALVLEPLELRWLPADRVADSAWLGYVLSAGLTVGRLVTAAGEGARTRAGLALAALAGAVLLALPSRTLALWPVVSEWPRYATIERGARLDALWSTLRAAPAGRVLFVRSSVPIVYGTQWWRPHSHVTALTPLATGRQIVNGTFTHPSPLAALLYRGDAGRGAIRELVERLDGRRLFGRDLGALDADTFNTYADRLGIAVVVGLDEDLPRLRFVADNPAFARPTPSPPFVVYTRRSGIVLPSEVGPGRLRLAPDGPADSWQSTRTAYYPLWRASTEGQIVPTRRGSLGDLEIRVPRAGTAIDLVYARGPAETTGLAITVASLAALAIVWLRTRRHGARAPRVSKAATTLE